MKLGKNSALDLTLKGSVGSFKVASTIDGDERGGESLEVKFLLSHVSLDYSSGQDNKILSELAPVREIFDFKQLDFDEIMQRDIDDSRVSSKLIPYILDENSRDLIKFFPPIVIFVLPIEESRTKPLKLYPKVSSGIEELKENDVKDWMVTRAGEIGSEVFEFSQPILNGEPLEHDLVNLKLNTSRSRMVIVDGQHRAMALLALHRNLKDEWNDANRKPFEKYYAQWTPDYISKFDLKNIRLPMIICTVPELCEGFKGDYDIKRASRSIFLTLNKNAQAVSRSRNILLNDNDLISSFMRGVLSNVKNQDEMSSSSFRIHNVELDQEGDKMRLTNPVAITGVSHLYYIIEHVLLNNNDLSGVRPRSGSFSKRIVFTEALNRLDAFDILGQDVLGQTRRHNFSTDTEISLNGVFVEKYGKYIARMFEELSIYEIHNKEVLKLNNSLEEHQDRQLKPMLFAGQGIQRVFESHLTSLKEKYDRAKRQSIPQVDSLIQSLEATKKRLEEAISEFKDNRSSSWLDNIDGKSKLKSGSDYQPKFLRLVRSIYDNVFSTIAFQSAIICTFFNEVEVFEIKNGEKLKNDEVDSLFAEYVSSLNDFFAPDSFAKFKACVSILEGEVRDDGQGDLVVNHASPYNFRSVVYPGEMQPDQWPKYRYLILELWTTEDENLASILAEQLEDCRQDVAAHIYSRSKVEIAKAKNKLVEELSENERSEACSQAYETFSNFLGYLRKKSSLSEHTFKEMLRHHQDIDDEF